MYAKALGALVALLLLASPASAHQRHHHYASRHHHAIHWGALPKSPEWPHSTAFGPRWTDNAQHITVGGSRPRAWCGWFMRQVEHVVDPAYNLARNWAHWGRPAGGPTIGAIVVWPHHVGKIVGQEQGKWVVLSGNDGHRVRTRPRSLAGAIAFRI